MLWDAGIKKNVGPVRRAPKLETEFVHPQMPAGRTHLSAVLKVNALQGLAAKRRDHETIPSPSRARLQLHDEAVCSSCKALVPIIS